MDRTPAEPTSPLAVVAPLPTRRRVLAIVAVTGAGGVLTACGGGADDTATTGSGGESSDAGSSSPSESGSASADGGGRSGLVATADVPVGGGVILEQANLVVTQPTEGTFKGFSATCTHQSCTVASVKNGTISCSCHGSAFSAADGSVKNGPATRALKEVSVKVEGDKVVKA